MKMTFIQSNANPHIEVKNLTETASSAKRSSGHNLTDFSSSQNAASDAGTPTTNQQTVLRRMRNVNTAARSATTQGCACNNIF